MTLMSNDGTDHGPFGIAGGALLAKREVSGPWQPRTAVPPAMTIRLVAADVRRGRLVSIDTGNDCRLWVVDQVTEGAGDGCVELTLIASP